MFGTPAATTVLKEAPPSVERSMSSRVTAMSSFAIHVIGNVVCVSISWPPLGESTVTDGGPEGAGPSVKSPLL